MYSVRRLDGFSLAPNHEMRFSPFRAFPPIQSRYTQLSISPPSVPFFPRRRIGEPYSIRRAAPLFGLAGRDAPVFLPAFPSRLAGRICLPLGSRSTLVLLSLCSPLPYSSNRLLAFLLASRSVGRLGVSPTISFPIRQAGREAYFSHTYPFSTSIPPRHVIHYPIYMRAWWNGRHARFRFWWRNPCGFESHRPHHGNVIARLRSPFR